jgi:conjugative transfer signal peptidase TraF
MSRRGVLAVGVLGIGALAWSPPTPRLVWNATASAPIGLYRLELRGSIARGDLVFATLPDSARRLAASRGYLPSNVPLVKRVEALAGDRICAAGDGIIVNERVVARRLPADGQGRPLPAWQGCRTLAATEILLLTESVPDSFDGRYFGPIGTDHILGRLVPLWTR